MAVDALLDETQKLCLITGNNQAGKRIEIIIAILIGTEMKVSKPITVMAVME